MVACRRALLICLLSLGWQNDASVAGKSVPRGLRETEPTTREHRFPSVEERIRLYMSNWYVPPCRDYEDGLVRYSWKESGDKNSEWPTLRLQGYPDHPLFNSSTTMEVESIISPDMLFYMDPETIVHCANSTFVKINETNPRSLLVDSRIEFRLNMRMYCHDVKDSLFAAWQHIQFEQTQLKASKTFPPILLQFGDNKESHKFKGVMVPHIKKFRSASKSPQDLEKVTAANCESSQRSTLSTVHGVDSLFQPIVWKLASSRHFDKLYEIYRKDTMWEDKKDMAIFRGQLTGSRDGYQKHSSDKENCHRLKRCRLVFDHANSTFIDARLTSTRGRLPHVLDGVALMSGKVDLSKLLGYKGIIMIEGNDVASGLKWALLSQSVVLMPSPKHTSWAMEELLEPWVHYIPLDDFATNVEQRMRWVVDNEEEARRIAERGTLWMEDLVFHPDAPEDDRLIQEEILRRYSSHFQTK